MSKISCHQCSTVFHCTPWKDASLCPYCGVENLNEGDAPAIALPAVTASVAVGGVRDTGYRFIDKQGKLVVVAAARGESNEAAITRTRRVAGLTG